MQRLSRGLADPPIELLHLPRKRLLFVGDAQWSNWAYWLYGKATGGKDPGISERAKA